MKSVAAALFVVASVASAQATLLPTTGRTTVLVFEPDDIAGERDTSLLDPPFVAGRGPDFESLIKVREAFREKALQSVSEL